MAPVSLSGERAGILRRETAACRVLRSNGRSVRAKIPFASQSRLFATPSARQLWSPRNVPAKEFSRRGQHQSHLKRSAVEAEAEPPSQNDAPPKKGGPIEADDIWNSSDEVCLSHHSTHTAECHHGSPRNLILQFQHQTCRLCLN